MKRHTILTGANLSFDFLSYSLVTSKAWKLVSGKDVVVGLVTNPESSPTLLEFLSSKIRLHPIPALEGVEEAVQAKFSRLWLSQMNAFSEEILTIADLDMIPLSNLRNGLLGKCTDKQFIKWGFDHIAYSNPDDYGKWPMDGSTSTGIGFQQVVNPDRLSFEKLVQKWSELPEIGRGNPFNKPTDFSDETLLREIWPKKCDLEIIKLGRVLIEEKPMSGRIDRAKRLPLRKPHKLISQGAFEFHGPRPFPFKSRFGRNLLSYLEIPYKEFLDDMAFIRESLV